MKKTHGFTLVELIIVIAVIGILAAILIPVFSNVIDKANEKSALSDARNTVEQYIIDKTEMNLPEHLFIAVVKGGNYYLYGYEPDNASVIRVSEGNPYKNIDSMSDLMEKFSFNKKHPGEIPVPGKTDYDAVADGTFYLVPYTDEGVSLAPDIKGFHGTKADEKYYNISQQLSSKLSSEENVVVYHGILLGATWEEQTIPSSPIPTQAPTPTPASTPTPTPDSTPIPTPAAESVYYYGSTYRNINTNKLVFSDAETLPANANPLSIIDNPVISGNSVSMQYSLQNGQTITRTFTFDANKYAVVENTTYYKCTETTNWRSVGITNPVFVEKTAGATVTGSISIDSLKSTNNDTYIGAGKTIVLVNDIELTGEWLPIAFNGIMNASFDGMGYAVNGVKISSPAINSIYGVGFIANIGASGSVVNLMLPNAQVEHLNTNSVQFYVGIAVGKNAGTVKNVHTDGTANFKNSEKGLGGVVGYSQAVSSIINCSSAATLTNNKTATGGILGRADAGTITITNCHFYGTINGTDSLGGIVGYIYSSATVNISNCSCGSYSQKP